MAAKIENILLEYQKTIPKSLRIITIFLQRII